MEFKYRDLLTYTELQTLQIIETLEESLSWLW